MSATKDYEKLVMEHYSKVAKVDGDSSSSTMKNEYVRKEETKALLKTIDIYMKKYGKEEISVVDIGCGNGYTLSVLKETWPHNIYFGLEKNDDLRTIACKRLNPQGIKVVEGDIRDNSPETVIKADVIICQRVIINLLDEEDQKLALRQLSRLVNDQGIIIFIECFNEPLANLNEARSEYELEEILPSYHNRYIDMEIFEELGDTFSHFEAQELPPSNFLSSHYYISRVLHDVTLQGKPFKRNSHFVQFMTEVVPPSIGDFSAIKLYVFQNRGKK